MSAIRTTCPYCGVGCGLLAAPDGRGGAKIKGDPDHPANFGRLCSKGSALGETLDMEGRLLAPRIAGAEAGWDAALDLVAAKFREAIAEHGPDSVAFYVSGQLLTEDYYVANKLMKGFIGSANIDTNSRLCMASSVAGHNRAFGADAVPGTYEDLEEADLVVLVGSNLAWCHPVLYQRIAAAKAARPGMRVVNVDPRRTATSDLADMHLPLNPGSDVMLFNGLLAHLETSGALDAAYVEAHVAGLPEAMEAARAAKPRFVSAATGLSEADLAAFYALFAATEKTVTVYSQGVNQSASGSDKVNAIINCHLAAGRIGAPGMGPFSVTGQPNAMGGREVGGLANMLACHMAIENPDHRAAVQAFWASPRICRTPGLKAVDLFEACADGRIKALWVMSTNPAVSMPDADAVRSAIAATPFVAVSDVMEDTDTCRLADVLLPAAAWGEKSGAVTNSDRTISRQRPFLPKPANAREDWRIICDVAARMGWGDAFAYDGPAAIFREHAALSGVAAGFGRDFDITGLAGLSDEAYGDLNPVRWPVSAPKAGCASVAKDGGRFFGNGGFFTPDRKARMIPVTHRPSPFQVSEERPIRLNTGRVRDHWHTMTRTAKTGRLSQHIAEPYVELHPEDARDLGLGPADLALIEGAAGEAVARVLVTDRVRKGSAFAPIHWTSVFASAGRVGAAIEAAVDPVSGQPDLKGTPVRLSPFGARWCGFAISRAEFTPATAYWARARTATGWRAELAGVEAAQDWEAFAKDLFGAPDAEIVAVHDRARRKARVVLERDGRAFAALYVGPSAAEISRAQAIEALEGDAPSAALLAGRLADACADPGKTVCSCFGVGANAIAAAIAEGGLRTAAQIGEALGAGSNCGSCLPDVNALIKAHADAGAQVPAQTPPAYAVRARGHS